MSKRPYNMFWLVIMATLSATVCGQADDELFRKQVAPILARRCLSCHDAQQRKGDLSLETRDELVELDYIVEGDPDASYLVELVTPSGGRAEMPKNSDPLKDEEVEVVRSWIAAGGVWPAEVKVEPLLVTDTDWWSLRPLTRPVVPGSESQVRAGRVAQPKDMGTNPIDRFIAAKHDELGLSFAPEASRRTLIRRLYFDLNGLPPTPRQIEQFVNDSDPAAYSKLVDKLLDSPQYGERWARHWLDVVHYADTHGYDKDKLRLNAWPYRDYVIRSLNEDKSWSRFVEEQVAGDILYPDTRDGIEALGFIAAGPWDFVGHAEVPESKIDGKIARHLDRDDMVRNTIQSFNSLTVGCAQCHNHKFDPISQEDYYSLHAVFAALDRADKAYFADAGQRAQHERALARQRQLADRRRTIEAAIRDRAGGALVELEAGIEKLEKDAASVEVNPTLQFGYHSAIAKRPEDIKWVQIDLGSSITLKRVELWPAFDSFNSIGAGFGFPRRFRVEAADDPKFQVGIGTLASFEDTDFINPGIERVVCGKAQFTARYIRITATKLAPRKDDYIFALAEVMAFDAAGANRARDATVTALDSIEAAPRWGRVNLVDGSAPRHGIEDQLQGSRGRRDRLWQANSTDAQRSELEQIGAEMTAVAAELRELQPNHVYAGTVYQGAGSFAGTGADGGRPRSIRLLIRGDVRKPGREVSPGTLRVFDTLPGRFELPSGHGEGARRAALAHWLAAKQNHLTWRSIVNRVWQYHFGRGLVETPNDFGRMGAQPTHLELLDWLAVEFRDGGQSLKSLHKLMVTSYTYRQSSSVHDAQHASIARVVAADADNRFLWKMRRRKLEAEAVRDSILLVSGKLDTKMAGPAFRDFVLEKPEHSPHYEYHLHDPEDPECHRRSIYRFIVRSQLQPFMNALDCADPSLQVARRGESLTPLQALALLNDGLVIAMSGHFAARLEQADDSLRDKVRRGFLEAVGRVPSTEELDRLTEYAERFGLVNYCRLVFNLNEFSFVD